MKALFFLSLPLLLFNACQPEVEKTQPRVEKITSSVYASGVIKSIGQYQVFSTTGGLIQTVAVRAGDIVKKGDPLFIIRHEASQLQAENARLSADFAVLNTRGDRLRELEGSIALARTKASSDSMLLVRQQALWAQQIGSKVELEQRELAYQTSVSNHRAAVLRYQEAKKQYDFAAAQAQKQVSISNTLAQDYTVRAQADGRVYTVYKSVGEVVNAQVPLAVVGSADGFIAELQIDENDITRIRPQQRVLLTMDSYEGEVFEAVVDNIDPLMNERTRTFSVEVSFTKRPPTLYPNLTVEANIVISEKEDALTIPRAYLVQDSFVVLENEEERRVIIGLKDYRKVEILEGLQPNETIIMRKK